ncbi:hypothetical protein JK364_23665 [Streptomyces sp. 110]|uniref:Uncharacterized protein n=1 Tax=Streptomyces endocoffeicus TaxID=2898945 RepID=A0ABS1PTX5_9ACTN|nr:hypothetical protein [Streptomyces endocoffeicus]MBL1115372.1 hypothetical protein [Streptomyces endocoffeicus]
MPPQAPPSVISDIITDLLRWADHNGWIGEQEHQTDKVEALTNHALMNFAIERNAANCS